MNKLLLILLLIAPFLLFAQKSEDQLREELHQLELRIIELDVEYEEHIKRRRETIDDDELDEDEKQAILDEIEVITDPLLELHLQLSEQKLELLRLIELATISEIEQRDAEERLRMEQYNWPEITLNDVISWENGAFKLDISGVDNAGKSYTTTDLNSHPFISEHFNISTMNITHIGGGEYVLNNALYLVQKYASVQLSSKEDPSLYKVYTFPIDFNHSYVNDDLYRPAQGTITINMGLQHTILMRTVKDELTGKKIHEIAFNRSRSGEWKRYILEEGNTLTFNVESMNSALDWDTAFSIYTDKIMNWQEVIIINHTGLSDGQYTIIEQNVEPKVQPLKARYDISNATNYFD